MNGYSISKLPNDAARKKPQREPDGIRLPLPDLEECASTSGMTVGDKIEDDVVLKERLEP
jgi:hypothetical protein